jgi:hypothetical protein
MIASCPITPPGKCIVQNIDVHTMEATPSFDHRFSTDRDTMSPSERTHEVAGILARAVVRLHTRGVHSPTTADSGDSFGDITEPASFPLPSPSMPTSMAAPVVVVHEPRRSECKGE